MVKFFREFSQALRGHAEGFGQAAFRCWPDLFAQKALQLSQLLINRAPYMFEAGHQVLHPHEFVSGIIGRRQFRRQGNPVTLPLRWRWRLDRWKERLASMFRASPKPPRPRLCPACGKLVGASATKCHECGASLTFSLAAASRSLSGLMPTESPVTYFILGLNFFFFGVSLLATLQAGGGLSLFGGISGEVLLRLGARQSRLILEGEWWRLVMPIFLHGGLLHFGFNTIVLMDLGTQVEELYGSARYLFVYVVTGVMGFVVSTLWNLHTMGGYGLSIGASGSLMGLIGVMLAVTQRRGGSYMRAIRSSLIKWVIYIFVLGLFFAFDNAAHFGGLAAGYLLGQGMADREPYDPGERKRAYFLAWLAALAVIASFVSMLFGYFRTN
jgi:rhomboid protease GluP